MAPGDDHHREGALRLRDERLDVALGQVLDEHVAVVHHHRERRRRRHVQDAPLPVVHPVALVDDAQAQAGHDPADLARALHGRRRPFLLLAVATRRPTNVLGADLNDALADVEAHGRRRRRQHRDDAGLALVRPGRNDDVAADGDGQVGGCGEPLVDALDVADAPVDRVELLFGAGARAFLVRHRGQVQGLNGRVSTQAEQVAATDILCRLDDGGVRQADRAPFRPAHPAEQRLAELVDGHAFVIGQRGARRPLRDIHPVLLVVADRVGHAGHPVPQQDRRIRRDPIGQRRHRDRLHDGRLRRRPHIRRRTGERGDRHRRPRRRRRRRRRRPDLEFDARRRHRDRPN